MKCLTRWSLALALLLSASGLAAALPAHVPTGAQQTPVVAIKGCKYKTDGTGNCLSPAFYRCQKQWTKYTEACGGKPKCIDACELKYAPQCGD